MPHGLEKGKTPISESTEDLNIVHAMSGLNPPKHSIVPTVSSPAASGRSFPAQKAFNKSIRSSRSTWQQCRHGLQQQSGARQLNIPVVRFVQSGVPTSAGGPTELMQPLNPRTFPPLPGRHVSPPQFQTAHPHVGSSHVIEQRGNFQNQPAFTYFIPAGTSHMENPYGNLNYPVDCNSRPPMGERHMAPQLGKLSYATDWTFFRANV